MFHLHLVSLHHHHHHHWTQFCFFLLLIKIVYCIFTLFNQFLIAIHFNLLTRSFCSSSLKNWKLKHEQLWRNYYFFSLLPIFISLNQINAQYFKTPLSCHHNLTPQFINSTIEQNLLIVLPEKLTSIKTIYPYWNE